MARIVIYTDGSALGNPGPGGWAYVSDDPEHRYRGRGNHPYTTSNRMEFAALIAAIRAVPEGSELEVRTDSRLLINLVEGKWKPHKAEIQELLRVTRQALKKRGVRLHLRKVRSKRSEGNLLADQLAKNSMQAVLRELPTRKCPVCGRIMVPRLRNADGEPFFACIDPECGETSPMEEQEAARAKALIWPRVGLGTEPVKARSGKRRRR